MLLLFSLPDLRSLFLSCLNFSGQLEKLAKIPAWIVYDLYTLLFLFLLCFVLVFFGCLVVWLVGFGFLKQGFSV